MVSSTHDPRRLAALAEGRKKYLGAECGRAGHGTERNTINGQCAECGRGYSRERARRQAAESAHEKQPVRLARESCRRARELAIRSEQATFDGGLSCKRCGGTVRWASLNTCTTCYAGPSDPVARAVRQAERDAKVASVISRKLQRAKKRKLYTRRARIKGLLKPPKQTRDERLARHKDWWAANKDTQAAKRRDRMADPGVRAEKQARDRAYRLKNSAYYRLKRHERKALERGAEGFTTPEQLEEIVVAHEGLCAYCDKPWEHVDHKTPLARGGSNWRDNLQPLCAYHNCAKQALTDDEYRLKAGLPVAGRFVCAA